MIPNFPNELGFDVFEERDRKIETAARNIIATARSDQFGRGWRPKGNDEVAILLESLGYSAEVVAELWYDSIFDFARDVAGVVDKYITDEERARERSTNWFSQTCRDYAIGSLYAGPWIIAVLGLAAFGSALWSSLSTPLHLATAIALGVYAALIVSGVFSQSIARRLTFYFLQDNAALMLWTLDRFIALASATFVVFGVATWLVLRQLYGDPDAWLAASFFAGSGIFQVSLAPLYTMRRFAWIVGVSAFATTLTGLTFVVAFGRKVDLPWEPAVLAFEVGAIGAAVMIATLVWARRHARDRSGDLKAPALRTIVSAAVPYAGFGAAYFSMIVLDHVAAGLRDGVPYVYRTGYELGCDIALLAVIPVVGVINVALESLPRRILRAANAGIAQGEPFNREMLRWYALSSLGVCAATALAVGVAELIAPPIIEGTLTTNTLIQAETMFVLRLAAVGYGLLMLGLMNCQLLFFLSRPKAPLIAAVAGALVCAIGGTVVVATRFPAAYCVFALDGGIVVFVSITTLAALRAAANFTYAYYAAY
jgi:hypothetical protein